MTRKDKEVRPLGRKRTDKVKSNETKVKTPGAVCSICQLKCNSRNELHRHISLAHGLDKSRQDKKKPIKGQPIIVKSAAPPSTARPGWPFKGCKYAEAMARLNSPANEEALVCMDTGCTISLIDRSFLDKHCPGIKVNHLDKRLPVTGIASNRHDASAWVLMPLYFETTNGCLATFTREIHAVDKLGTTALIGIDIIKPEGWVLDPRSGLATLTQNQNLQVKLVTAAAPTMKRILKSLHATVMPPHSQMFIPVRQEETGLKTFDCLFEPGKTDNEMGLYAQLTRSDCSIVLARSDSDRTIKVPKGTKLGKLRDIDEDEIDARPAPQDYLGLAMRPSIKEETRRHEVRAMLVRTQSHIEQKIKDQIRREVKLQSGVTIFGNEKQRTAWTTIVDRFKTRFDTERGNIAKVPESQQMEIPLVEDWDKLYKPGRAKVYNLGLRDRQFIDATFDKLHHQNRLEWTQKATPFSFPCFVVWTKDDSGMPKGRVVVDIRALNKIVIPDAYPVPNQSDILAELAGCMYLTVVDAASFFYQWLVKATHRHRLTVVSH